MQCKELLALVTLLATRTFCADWEAFQDHESSSNDIASGDSTTLSDTGALDLFTNNGDFGDSSTLTNADDPLNLFDSGELTTTSNPLDWPSNLVAGVDDTCSFSPARRRHRARADGGASCSNGDAGDSIHLPTLNSDMILNNDNLMTPRVGHRVTDYENDEQRMTGQAYCPSHKIILPGLIIPVCNSAVPGFTQNMIGSVLFTLYGGFMSMLSSLSLISRLFLGGAGTTFCICID